MVHSCFGHNTCKPNETMLPSPNLSDASFSVTDTTIVLVTGASFGLSFPSNSLDQLLSKKCEP